MFRVPMCLAHTRSRLHTSTYKSFPKTPQANLDRRNRSKKPDQYTDLHVSMLRSLAWSPSREALQINLRAFLAFWKDVNVPYTEYFFAYWVKPTHRLQRWPLCFRAENTTLTRGEMDIITGSGHLEG